MTCTGCLTKGDRLNRWRYLIGGIVLLACLVLGSAAIAGREEPVVARPYVPVTPT